MIIGNPNFGYTGHFGCAGPSGPCCIFFGTQNPNSLNLVAEADFGAGKKAIAGMIVVWVIVDEAHIGTVAVDAAYRRQGIGRQLVTRALLASLERGARQAYLEVRRGNLAAQALYLQLGFEVVGERRRYYHDNHEDALLMTLNRLDQISLSAWVLSANGPWR